MRTIILAAVRRIPFTARHLMLSASVVCVSPGVAVADLLTNADLNSPGLHEMDLADGWTLVEPNVDGLGAPVNSATFATFADHTPGAGGVGLWFRSFEGGLGGDEPFEVDADLYQDVPGTPGLAYSLTAWFRMEPFYSGLVAGAPTQTILALQFLNGAGVLDVAFLDIDSVYVQDNTWQQFAVLGIAPAGTTTVRARASMIDGVLSDGNPQSAFVDDFELLAVPEPASASLALLGLAALAAYRRRRLSRHTSS